MQARSRNVLKYILAFSILSTGLHFTHNFVEIDQYPQSDLISNGAVQALILVSWPLLTAIGLYGYRLYAQGRYPRAQVALGLYSLLGIATLGHFTEGSPDIPAFWYVTIFTDGLAGLAVLGFAIWSLPSPARESRRAA